MGRKTVPVLAKYQRRNGAGVPLYILEMTEGTYEGVVERYSLLDTAWGKKLCFYICITEGDAKGVVLKKQVDYEGHILKNSSAYLFLEQLEVIEKNGSIAWKEVNDIPVMVDVRESSSGTPYVKSVMVIHQEEIEMEEEDEDYDEEEFDWEEEDDEE